MKRVVISRLALARCRDSRFVLPIFPNEDQGKNESGNYGQRRNDGHPNKRSIVVPGLVQCGTNILFTHITLVDGSEDVDVLVLWEHRPESLHELSPLQAASYPVAGQDPEILEAFVRDGHSITRPRWQTPVLLPQDSVTRVSSKSAGPGWSLSLGRIPVVHTPPEEGSLTPGGALKHPSFLTRARGVAALEEVVPDLIFIGVITTEVGSVVELSPSLRVVIAPEVEFDAIVSFFLTVTSVEVEFHEPKTSNDELGGRLRH
uniref:Uncharacterized protein n=1 Tax=Timema douglasi TaxID=61478 RepID=A0A7R8VLP3_TIMDO|nr:unnamed protein product [Timema douglasi]